MALINMTLRRDSAKLWFHNDALLSLNCNHIGVAVIIAGGFVAELLNLTTSCGYVDTFVMCRSTLDYLIVNRLFVAHFGYQQVLPRHYTGIFSTRREQFSIVIYKPQDWGASGWIRGIRYIVLLPKYLVGDDKLLHVTSSISDNVITLERAYLELVDAVMEFSSSICRYFILGNSIYNTNTLSHIYRTPPSTSIRKTERTPRSMPSYMIYAQHNGTNQLIKSTLHQLYPPKPDVALATSEHYVCTYIAMIDRQASSSKVYAEDELKLPNEWNCWRVRYSSVNGSIQHALQRSHYPPTKITNSCLPWDTQLLQKPYSHFRFTMNSSTISFYTGLVRRAVCVVNYDRRYRNAAIQLAHNPCITCLDELWWEIEHTPSLQTVFFNALVSPLPEKQSSFSIRSLFERHFRFSVLNAQPEQCGSNDDDVDATQGIKRQKVIDCRAVKDYESMYPTKSVIILDEHTMADYWAPDDGMFKSYARFGAFRYTSWLSPPASTTATDVRQSGCWRRMRILLPTELHKNGLPPVLFS